MTWETIRQLVVSLPGIEESTSYGTPALKVNRKLFARLHQDGENVVVRIEKKDRATLMRANPAFHVTDALTGDAFDWRVGRNFVRLAPGGAHVLTLA